MAALEKEPDGRGREIHTVTLSRQEAASLVVGLVGALSGTGFAVEQACVTVYDVNKEPSPLRMARIVFLLEEP